MLNFSSHLTFTKYWKEKFHQSCAVFRAIYVCYSSVSNATYIRLHGVLAVKRNVFFYLQFLSLKVIPFETRLSDRPTIWIFKWLNGNAKTTVRGRAWWTFKCATIMACLGKPGTLQVTTYMYVCMYKYKQFTYLYIFFYIIHAYIWKYMH